MAVAREEVPRYAESIGAALIVIALTESSAATGIGQEIGTLLQFSPCPVWLAPAVPHTLGRRPDPASIAAPGRLEPCKGGTSP